MNSIIEFKEVVKTYGEKENLQYAVDHIDLSIPEGHFVVILGPSGAGKSTVLNMIGGMDKPSSGDVYVDGVCVSQLNDKQLSDYRAQKIGFIFQFYNLIASMTALENVAVCKSIVKDAYDPKEMLESVGLGSYGHKFPSQLSGGEQQRVSIARALAKHPKIILGDEPTGALDSKTGGMILELLQKLSREKNHTVILVTHNAEIAKCADTVIYMKNGKISSQVENEHPLLASEVEW